MHQKGERPSVTLSMHTCIGNHACRESVCSTGQSTGNKKYICAAKTPNWRAQKRNLIIGFMIAGGSKR